MLNNCIVLITLFSCVSACNINCNGGGVCSLSNTSICDCRPLFDGQFCQEKWLDNPLFSGVFITYTVYEILLQVFLTSYAIYQFSIVIRDNQFKWSIPVVILILCGLGGILRIIAFSVDSHNSRGILSPVAFNLLFDIPLLLWLISGFMLYLFWIEIQHNLNKNLSFITRFRPILIAFIVITTILVIGVEIFNSTTNSSIGSVLYLIVFAIMFLGLIGMITYSGAKMVQVLRRAYKHTGNKGHFKLLKQLLMYMAFIDGCLIASVACVISYTYVLSSRSRGGFLIVHSLFRTLEFGVVFGTLVFLERKKTDKPSSGDQESNNKSVASINVYN